MSKIKYGCGHESGGAIILDDNEMSMIAYLDWVDTVGMNGMKLTCWDCYCTLSKAKPKDI